MNTQLIPTNALTLIDGEPRIRDTILSVRLGMLDPHKIRETIRRNAQELELHGSVSARQAETSQKGGRPSEAYYLNEGQALVICALSRTERAAEMRKQLIDVFMAYRAGKIVHVREHRRSRALVHLPDVRFIAMEAHGGMREAKITLMVPFETAVALAKRSARNVFA